MSTVTAILTRACNLKCAYCYQDAKDGRRMPWPTLRRAIDLLCSSPLREIRLCFYGGEPLLESGLIERALRYARGTAGARTVRFAVTTNGTLLDDGDTRLLLARWSVETYLSHDGIAAAQDRRGPGTFDTLDRVLVALRREHPAFFARSVAVAVTVDSGNVGCLADSIAYFIDRGVQQIAISPVFTHDAGWNAATNDELARQMERVVELSRVQRRTTGRVPVTLLRTSGAEPAPFPGGAACGAGSGESLVVDADGQVHACVLFTEGYQRIASPLLRSMVRPMRLGHIDEPGLPLRLARLAEAAAQAGLAVSREHWYSAFSRCAECRFAGECDVCPIAIGHIPHNEDPHRVPDHLCVFNQVVLGARRAFEVTSERSGRLRDPVIPERMAALRNAVRNAAANLR